MELKTARSKNDVYCALLLICITRNFIRSDKKLRFFNPDQ